MNLWDIIDLFVNIFNLLGDTKTNKKRKKPRIFIFFNILLVISILGLAIEVRSIVTLVSPIIFLGLFIIVGFILTFGTIILLYKLALIEELRIEDFFHILIPVTLMTIPLASFVNRTYEIYTEESLVPIRELVHKKNISQALVKLDGEEMSVQIPKTISALLQNGDSILVQKKTGLMGFAIIGDIRNVK